MFLTYILFLASSFNLVVMITSQHQQEPTNAPVITTRAPFYPTVITDNPPLTNTSEEIIGEEPYRQNFVEWLLGVVGINQEQENPQQPVTPPHDCVPCNCGLTYKSTRIVGGVETQVNQYPWMTILKYNDRFFCGASVINNKYLLTAAHCVTGHNKQRLSAVFLDHDRSTPYETKTFTRRISAIFKHPRYNTGGAYNNDIALLKVDEELPLNGILKPVCLPQIGRSFSGQTGIVTGWGATAEHGQIANKLQEVSVPILSNVDCRKTAYGNKITDNMLCAGHPKGSKDSCQGDSGGPLHVAEGSKFVVAGIVSWGEGCAQANHPGVYARVNRFVTWIKSNTQDACYCQ